MRSCRLLCSQTVIVRRRVDRACRGPGPASRKGSSGPLSRSNVATQQAGELALGPSVKLTQRQTDTVDTSDRDFQRRVVFGLGLVVLLFFGFGGWAASSQLSGAVIAPGRVVVDSS